MLIVWKIDLLTGASPTVNLILVGLVPIVFALGVLYALHLRRSKPEIYAKLTTTDIDAEELAS